MQETARQSDEGNKKRKANFSRIDVRHGRTDD
jgi:hypothetical protein